jgi:hypothetical protein
MRADALVGRIRGEAGKRGREVKRELTRPWREGRSGAPAEIGRWLGLGLALGALIVGVAAGLRAARGE